MGQADETAEGITLKACKFLMMLCATLFTWQSNVFAQDYPNRVVRIIVPYAAGGSTDIPARLIAKRLTEQWSQPVLVENRAGAGGNIGTASVARAPADGYTLLISYSGYHVGNPCIDG